MTAKSGSGSSLASDEGQQEGDDQPDDERQGRGTVSRPVYAGY